MRAGAHRAARAVSGDHTHDVGLLHDQELLTIDLDLGARPLAEQNAVASLHVEGDELLIMKESDIMGVLTDLPAAKKKAA